MFKLISGWTWISQEFIKIYIQVTTNHTRCQLLYIALYFVFFILLYFHFISPNDVSKTCLSLHHTTSTFQCFLFLPHWSLTLWLVFNKLITAYVARSFKKINTIIFCTGKLLLNINDLTLNHVLCLKKKQIQMPSTYIYLFMSRNILTLFCWPRVHKAFQV